METFQARTLYRYKFISQCLPIYAFYTVLFLKRGRSAADVAVLMALWSVLAIVVEIPSGALADRWNRRNMLVVATALQGLCFLIWVFSYTFWMFALGFVFWAISDAFTSGTEEGLIYDNLKSDGHEESFPRVYGKARFYANVGTIVGIASAGVLASFISIEAIALISAVICFANALFALQLREKNVYAERFTEESGGFWGTLKEAGGLFKGSRAAVVCVSFFALFASLGGYLDEFDALIIHDFQHSHVWVSVILAVRFAFVALGNLLAPMVEKRVSAFRWIFLLYGGACVLLAAFALLWSRYALPIFGLSFMLMAIAEVLLVNRLQKEIREEGRATVMSFYGAAQNVVMVCFSLVYAWLAGLFTLQQVYLILGVYGMVGGVSFFLLARPRK